MTDHNVKLSTLDRARVLTALLVHHDALIEEATEEPDADTALPIFREAVEVRLLADRVMA